MNTFQGGPTKEESKLVTALRAVPDPRRRCNNLRHLLVDVLASGFCAVLCGSDYFVEVEAFAFGKEAFFRYFLEPPDPDRGKSSCAAHCFYFFCSRAPQRRARNADRGGAVQVDGSESVGVNVWLQRRAA